MFAIVAYLRSGLAVMLLGTLAFSSGAVLIKLTGSRVPAMEIVFARCLVQTLYCWHLARRAGAYIPGNRKWLLFMRGALGFLAFFCVFYATIHLPLADATVINLGFPLIVPLWARMFLKEPLDRRTLACVMVGAAGMVLVAKPPMLFGGLAMHAPLATAVAVCAALLSSICVTMIRALTRTEHPLVIVLYAGVCGTIGAPLLDGWNWVVPTPLEALLLLIVGLCMSFGQHCITVGYSRAPASQASMMFYMEVVFSAIFGFLVFGTIPGALTIGGSVLIIGGAMLLAGRRSA